MVDIAAVLASFLGASYVIMAASAFAGAHRLKTLDSPESLLGEPDKMVSGFEMQIILTVLLLFGFINFTVDSLQGIVGITLPSFTTYLYIVGIGYNLLLSLIIYRGVKGTWQ